MFKFLEKYIMGPITKLSQFRLVRAITMAGMATIPFTIVGSIFLVINILPMVITSLQGFYNETFVKITDVYMLANKATMGIIALYFVMVIGYYYTKLTAQEEDLKLSPINGMLLSVFAFFMLIPQFTNKGGLKLISDAKNNIINGWAIGDVPQRLGAIGIFTAIIVGYIAINIYKLCVKHNIVIKMPDSVPEGVANSFTALIPAFFVALFILIVNGILIALGTDVFQMIAIPFGFVANIAGSYFGVMVAFFLISTLWLVGIHGATIISSMIIPVALYNMEQNQAGANLPFAGEFYNAFVFMGGSGSTLALILMLSFMSKSKQLRLLGRAALVPGLFNINEPIIFGLPIVYNPYFAIPFILAPMASASVAYFAIKIGIVHPIVALQPWPTPIGIGGFLATGGDFKGAILSVVCALVAGLIYFPFFKKRDNELYKEEMASENTK